MHKIERLFAAVAECDIRLASYYLGLEGPCSKIYISNNDDLQFCHPLCNCDKCVSIEERAFEKDSKPPIGINAMNSKGETALHIACGVGCLEIIQVFYISFCTTFSIKNLCELFNNVNFNYSFYSMEEPK